MIIICSPWLNPKELEKLVFISAHDCLTWLMSSNYLDCVSGGCICSSSSSNNNNNNNDNNDNLYSHTSAHSISYLN